MGLLTAVTLRPPGLAVTVYLVMVLPPVTTGSIKLTLACALPATALISVGASGTVAASVPDRLTLFGPPGASLFSIRLPVWEPATVGTKVTLMLQLAPAARLDVQVLVWANSPPGTERPMLVKAAVPVLRRVMLWAVPTARMLSE